MGEGEFEMSEFRATFDHRLEWGGWVSKTSCYDMCFDLTTDLFRRHLSPLRFNIESACDHLHC